MVFPKISIITPSFNQASYLERTMKSVIEQGYPNLEYIVVDGGSTDGSVEIITKYEKHLAYWVSEKDKGLYYALQKGFERSTGEIMGWINSDDVLQTKSLFTIAQIFTDLPSVNWIQGFPSVIDEHDRIVYVRPSEQNLKYYFYSLDYLSSLRFVQQESTFWKRELWTQAGSYISTEYKLASDFDLWIRFMQHEMLYNLNAILGSFRVRKSAQLSKSNIGEYIRETRDILAKNMLNKEEFRGIKYLKAINSIQRRLFFINLNFLSRRITKKFFKPSPSIIFDSNLQEFKIN